MALLHDWIPSRTQRFHGPFQVRMATEIGFPSWVIRFNTRTATLASLFWATKLLDLSPSPMMRLTGTWRSQLELAGELQTPFATGVCQPPRSSRSRRSAGPRG